MSWVKKWTKPKCYNGYNVKFVLLIMHFVAILKRNLSPWYCSYNTTIEPMKTQLSVWRWVLRSTQLCSALLVPSLHRSLCSNCSWNISPFYFYRRWVFGFFVSTAPTAQLILPKLVPCATLLRDLCVCMCVELPIFEEGQIWECRRFFFFKNCLSSIFVLKSLSAGEKLCSNGWY